MAILEVEHIEKSFDRTEVLKDITFSLEKGQVSVDYRLLGKRKDDTAYVV